MKKQAAMKSRISSRAPRLGWQAAMFVLGGMLLLGFLGCAPAGGGRSSSQDRIHSDGWYRERHERVVRELLEEQYHLNPRRIAELERSREELTEAWWRMERRKLIALNQQRREIAEIRQNFVRFIQSRNAVFEELVIE